jgi:vancomycin permeability regulator SanA
VTDGRVVLRPVLQVAVAGLVASIALLAYAAYRINVQGDLDEKRPADAIIVLGAAQFNGTPGGVFQARLEHAVELYHENVAKYLIVTGGKLPADRTTEAATARDWAIAHGVPAEAILGEFEGRTTLESIEAVGTIFREHDFTSGVFVSDETHMLRVLRMASDQGIVAWGSPTRTSPSDRDAIRRQRAVLHELAGLVAYYVGGGRLIEDAAITSNP